MTVKLARLMMRSRKVWDHTAFNKITLYITKELASELQVKICTIERAFEILKGSGFNGCEDYSQDKDQLYHLDGLTPRKLDDPKKIEGVVYEFTIGYFIVSFWSVTGCYCEDCERAKNEHYDRLDT